MTPFWFDYITCVNAHIQVLLKYQKGLLWQCFQRVPGTELAAAIRQACQSKQNH